MQLKSIKNGGESRHTKRRLIMEIILTDGHSVYAPTYPDLVQAMQQLDHQAISIQDYMLLVTARIEKLHGIEIKWDTHKEFIEALIKVNYIERLIK